MSWKSGRFWPWDLDEYNVLFNALTREQCSKWSQERLQCEEQKGIDGCFLAQNREKRCFSRIVCPEESAEVYGATDAVGRCFEENGRTKKQARHKKQECLKYNMVLNKCVTAKLKSHRDLGIVKAFTQFRKENGIADGGLT